MKFLLLIQRYKDYYNKPDEIIHYSSKEVNNYGPNNIIWQIGLQSGTKSVLSGIKSKRY